MYRPRLDMRHLRAWWRELCLATSGNYVLNSHTSRPTLFANHSSHNQLACPESTERTESELGEHRLSTTKQERARVRLPARGDRIAVDRTAAFGGDDANRACQRGFGDSLLSPVAVDEEARDPPIGRNRAQFAESSHSAGELCRGSELTPADDVRPVVDESRMCPIRSDQSLLVGPAHRSRLVRAIRLDVEGDAPAATPHTVVLLHDSREIRPCPRSELPDLKSRHELSPNARRDPTD